MNSVRVVVVSAVLSAALLVPGLAAAQTVVGVGISAYREDSRLNGVQQISVLETDESARYGSDDFLSASIWFLYAFSERVRFGSMLEYYGTYTGREKCEEGECDNPDFEPDRYEFGKLVEFHGRFEYAAPATEKFDLILGGVFGAPILFPGGDLKEEIERRQEEGASLIDLPRIGYLVGPNLGARWRYLEHLALRADVLVKWEQIFIFRTAQNIDGVAYRKRWTTGTLRYEFGLGLEVLL